MILNGTIWIDAADFDRLLQTWHATGSPSGGHTNLNGVNGAGKPTLLWLIPLFFGELPGRAGTEMPGYGYSHVNTNLYVRQNARTDGQSIDKRSLSATLKAWSI